jgi:hypothetical protein
MVQYDIVTRIASIIGTDEVVHVGAVLCLILTAIIALAMLWGIVRGIYVSILPFLKEKRLIKVRQKCYRS